MVEKLFGVARLHAKKRLHPLVGLTLQRRDAVVMFLIKPVGGNASLGNMMHVMGTNLKLQGCTKIA